MSIHLPPEMTTWTTQPRGGVRIATPPAKPPQNLPPYSRHSVMPLLNATGETMPVVFPTPEELERSPWRVQQATAKRLAEYRQQLRQVAANFDELVDAQVKERRAKVEQDIAQAHAARVEAAHILESLPPEPASLIAGRRHVALEAIYGRSA